MGNLKLPQLLIIAGTGRNAGKTTLVCSIIRKFSHTNSIIAVKITPHFHKNIQSGKVLANNNHYYISEETDPTTGKDSSLMLQSGAIKSYFIMTTDEFLEEAFGEIHNLIPPDNMLICESGGLRHHLTPGLFLMMKKSDPDGVKESAEKLLSLADRVINFNGEKIDFDPQTIEIKDNQWTLKQPTDDTFR